MHATQCCRSDLCTSVACLLHNAHEPRPYVAQGAAQAVEDAAALGILLSAVSSRYEIPKALQAYEKSRKHRAETVQQSGSENRIILHLPDGPEQIARDKQFRAAANGSNPDKWVDLETQKVLWGWDAEKAASDAWNGMSQFAFIWFMHANAGILDIGRREAKLDASL